MTRKRIINKKSQAILLGSLLISLGIALPLSKHFYHQHLDNKNDDMIEVFFEKKEDIDQEVVQTQEVKEETKSVQINYDYIAVLEIPSISLKRGLVDKNSIYNNINRNIQILKESDMPDIENGNFILASHSGTSYVSFFRNLDKIYDGNYIYVYYNNIKYTYKVVNMYEELKDGNITIHRDNNKTTLTLTTCSPSHDGYQLIVISELVNKESY